MKAWSIQDARELYRLDCWSAAYFDINDQGHIVACLGEQRVDLYKVAEEIHSAGYTLPILVRFPDILSRQVRALCLAFEQAQQAYGYQGKHTAVYPIKVNQQRCVVEQIAGSYKGRVGLEAGSKTELMAVLAQTLSHDELPDAPGTIVCNGYKDREYIRMALIGQKFGKRVFIVIEQLAELDLVLTEAEKLGVQPMLGVRIRLLTLGKGRWQNTGGLKSKFGLTAVQLLALIEKLKAMKRLADLKLIHFHMGSQISDLEYIRSGLGEAAAYFAQLCELGVSVDVVDVGGGVGVDYEGAHNNDEFSINYSLQEYADAVIAELSATCKRYNLPAPEIITEVGRALTAHHAVLITNVVDKELSLPAVHDPEWNSELELMGEFKSLYEMISSGSNGIPALIEKMKHCHHQLQILFKEPELGIKQRAELEKISALLASRLLTLMEDDQGYYDEKDTLQQRLACKYFCNFSVFQSMPDVWGLDQVFPIMPLSRLNEKPTARAVLHDLTCDSDGHIEHYVHRGGISKTLAVHDFTEGERYLLGFFLVGAYQETLGDIHNLFGDTHAINVVVDQNGHHFEEYESGDRADELLRYVHYDTDQLLRQYKQKLDATNLDNELKQAYFNELKTGLSGYTYLED